MRPVFSILSLSLTLVATHMESAVDVRDLGVPSGLPATDYDNHGNDLLNKGDYANARKYLTAAIRVEPDRWTAYYNRAMTFYMQKNWAAALPDLNATIRLQPAFFAASWARVGVYGHIGNHSARLRDLNTLADFAARVENIAEYRMVLNDRAWLRATCPDPSIRNGKLAVTDAKKTCDLSKWTSSRYIDTLAAACAEAGDFDGAVGYEEQAISVHQSGSDSATQTNKSTSESVRNEIAKAAQESMRGFSQRLQVYKQHHPYRDAPSG